MAHEQTTNELSEERDIERLAAGGFDDYSALYDQWEQPVVRALEVDGCAPGTAKVFFRTALLHAAELTGQGDRPLQAPFGVWLKCLAKSHYRSWAAENQDALEGRAPFEADIPLPDDTALSSFRKKIYAWQKLAETPNDCREQLLAHPEETESPDPCRSGYIDRLNRGAVMPGWAMDALRDQAGWEGFGTTLALEKFRAENKAHTPARSQNAYFWIALILFTLAVLTYIGSRLLMNFDANRNFEANYQPPKSIMADLEQRYGPARGNDSTGARPAACDQLLQQADIDYGRNRLEAAKDALLLIALDAESVCNADAWFYLAVISLDEKDPATALQCLAKIQDLEYFGEDIYWYQALAFVQMAGQNKIHSEKARRAILRFMDTTRDEERRKKAEKMLQDLGE